MTITIEPKSYEEIQKKRDEIEKLRRERLKEMLLPEGDYDFITKESYEKESKGKGEPMLHVILDIHHQGKNHAVLDWILCTEMWMEKLRSYCETTNNLAMYNSGSVMASRTINTKGRVRIIQEEHEKYGWQNKVDRYIVGNENENSKTKEQNTEVKDDDIPF